ncbi:unnamed protein product [Paramecium sonneborni]|uniref:Tetratricopeptide repeat protein n=1 Tax=Paramecium sonneborni TaxID=65129 RepID=A0A8S1RA02_9CILI|nr:unnamed protein product [Paramecium sonneborni]
MENLADELINQNQYEEAQKLYNQCEQTQSILIKQALLAHKIGLFKESINYYWLAYDKGEKKNEILIKIGKLQTQIGNYNQAIQVFNKILSIDQNNPIAMGELGYTYYCMEDHTNAISLYTKCSQFISIIPKFLTKLGNELYSEYKYNTAKLYFLTAYQIDNQVYNTVLGLVNTYMKLEEYEQSLQYCEILLKLDSNCGAGYLRKIQISIKINQLNEAEEIIKKLDLKLLDEQEHYDLIQLKGLILFKKQQYQDCINQLMNVVKDDQYLIQLHVLIAKCYYKLIKLIGNGF